MSSDKVVLKLLRKKSVASEACAKKLKLRSAHTESLRSKLLDAEFYVLLATIQSKMRSHCLAFHTLAENECRREAKEIGTSSGKHHEFRVSQI